MELSVWVSDGQLKVLGEEGRGKGKVRFAEGTWCMAELGYWPAKIIDYRNFEPIRCRYFNHLPIYRYPSNDIF